MSSYFIFYKLPVLYSLMNLLNIVIMNKVILSKSLLGARANMFRKSLKKYIYEKNI